MRQGIGYQKIAKNNTVGPKPHLRNISPSQFKRQSFVPLRKYSNEFSAKQHLKRGRFSNGGPGRFYPSEQYYKEIKPWVKSRFNSFKVSSQVPKNRVNFHNRAPKVISKISYDYKVNNGYKSPLLGSVRTRWIWVPKITNPQGPKQNWVPKNV